MSKAVKLFNGLNGEVVSKDQLKKIIIVGAGEGQTHLCRRIKTALAQANQQKDIIDFRIDTPAIEQVSSFDLPGLEEMPFYIDEEEFTGLNKAVSPDDIYQMITDKMIKLIEDANRGDYKKTWKDQEGYLSVYNFDSKKPYRGINNLMLTDMGLKVWKNPFFLTFNQIKKHKGHLVKGSKGHEVVYFTRMYNYQQAEPKLHIRAYDEKKFKALLYKNKSKINVLKTLSVEELTQQSVIPVLKYYKVFNGGDVEGIDFDLENFKKSRIANIEASANKDPRIEIADLIIANYPNPQPPLKHGGDRAFYSLSDFIQMPPYENYDSGVDYYRTLLHEYIHSTGHPKRLSRLTIGQPTKKERAKEELVAEFGAVFLSAHAGIMWRNNKNHAAYLKGWNSVLTHSKEDNRFLMRSASAAQKAADFILNNNEKGVPAYERFLKLTNKSKPKKKDAVPKKNIPGNTPKKSDTSAKKIIGFALVDNITGEIAASKKTLPELEKYYNENRVEFFKNMTPLVYEIYKAGNKNKLGKKLDSFKIKKLDPTPVKKEVAEATIKPKFKNGDAVQLTKQWGKVKKGSIGKISQRKQRFATNGDLMYRVTIGKTSLIYPEEVLQKYVTEPTPKKSDTPAKKITPKKREELIKQSRSSLTAKNKAEFEKALKKMGFSIFSVDRKNHSPNNFERIYNLNFKDVAGIILQIEVSSTTQKEIKAEFTYNAIGGKEVSDSYDEYENIGSFYDFLLDSLAVDFKMTMPEASALRKKHSDTLFTKKDKRQLALFGAVKEKKGLKSPQPQPIIQDTPKTSEAEAKHSGEVSPPRSSVVKHNKVQAIGSNTEANPLFHIPGETGKFFQAVEKKPKGSVVITLDGEQGAGKTTTLYKHMNDFHAGGNKCLFASLEEHPSSNLAKEKAAKYLSTEAYNEIDTISEFENYNEFCEIIQNYDSVFIDSWQKLLRQIGNIRIDEDLRKKFDGRVFEIIFQQTTTGRTKGGAEILFDGDIITKMVKEDSFSDNYAYLDKNRYATSPIENLRYMIAEGKTIDTSEETIREEKEPIKLKYSFE